MGREGRREVRFGREVGNRVKGRKYAGGVRGWEREKSYKGKIN